VANLKALTSWADKETEGPILDQLNLDEPWAMIEFFAPTYRLSGSADERKCVDYLTGKLTEWGVPHTLHEPTLFVSHPISAYVKTDGKQYEAKTPSMSTSTDGELTGELIYIPGNAGGFVLGDIFAAGIDTGETSIAGKIVLTEGFAMPGKVQDLMKGGAIGGIFINPGQNIHDGVCTTIWGSPDFDSMARQPSVPVVAVNNPDGQELIEYARTGGKITIHTKLDTRWRPIPIVVADIPGTEEPEKYILLHGHLDGWIYGVADNATGNATMAEIARVFWANRDKLKRSVKIAWWSGHSHGRYAGSTWFSDEYAIDLYNNCIAQVNCDSPGARWATTYNRLTVLTETIDFVTSTITDVTGIVPETERPPRAGDYSFNQIGLTGFYMLSSTMTEEKKKEQGFYEVGGCGGNIGWHTKDDTMELADRDNLIRDIRMYAASVLRVANAPVIPYNYKTTVADLRKTLESYAKAAGDVFDFTPIRNELDALDSALDVLYASVPGNPAIGDKQTGIVNRAQLRLGRILNPINYSRMEPFRHDPALTVAPLPDLTPALSAEKAAGDPAKLGVLKAHLTRGQNRIVWALQLAREEAERATV
jgi:N-acetylated-alpha-linked acidic dipeptidase